MPSTIRVGGGAKRNITSSRTSRKGGTALRIASERAICTECGRK